MSSYNRVVLMGNLTQTPELREIPGGKHVTDFTLAVNEVYNDSNGNRQENTSFVDITVWGDRAKTLCKYKKQGDALLVEGRLKQDKWEDKETGQKRSKLKVVATDYTFIGSSRNSEGDQERTSGSAPASETVRAGTTTGGPEVDPFH